MKTKIVLLITLAFLCLFLKMNAQYTKLLDFADTTKGTNPYGDLVYDGMYLYGMTRYGGANNYGIIFKMKSDGSDFQKLLDFNGEMNGANPQGSLLIVGNFLYGMTRLGGINNYGVIFKLQLDGTNYQKLFDFNIINGEYPYGGLITDGNCLYGMTSAGGIHGAGVIFKINYDGTGISNIFVFNGSSNGSLPEGKLTYDGNFFYGMTFGGGAYSDGVIFKVKPDGTSFTVLYDFNTISPTFNGANPRGSLISDSTNLYGMTFLGGTYSHGVVFKINKDGSGYTKLLNFVDSTGTSPNGSLILDGNYLYGMTYQGGVNNDGVVFKIKTNGSGYVKLNDFAGISSGQNPNGSLISDGIYLYGMTYFGGTNNKGVIFKNTKCLPNSGDTTVTACDNYTWYGNTYTSSATPTHILTNVDGCDSTVTLHLTVNYSNSGDTVATSCDNYTWYGNTYTTSATPTHVLTNAAGCDSTVTLHLTINHSNSGDTTAVACNNYTWYGNTYTTSATPTHVLTNAAGCDSIVTLHLTINHSNSGDTTAVACNDYTWYGNTYTTSATPTHVLSNSTGCDSTVTLHLTVNYSNAGDTTASACDNFSWYGTTFLTSGIATHTLLNSSGCDSVVTLHLTIKQSNGSDTTVIACDNFIWHGTEYTSSGVPTYITTNTSGCDSIISLHLTINETQSSGTGETDSICSNQFPYVNLFNYLTGNYATNGTWNDDDATGALSGIAFNTTAVTQGAYYHFTYSVTNSSPCENVSSQVILWVDMCENINTNDVAEIKVYPNPTNSKVFVENAGNSIIEVQNVLGSVIYSAKNVSGVAMIDLSDFTKGNYIIKKISQSNIIVKKVTLQ